MALPIWALYMKKNYANEDLDVSQEEFIAPEELSINIDCSKKDDEEEEVEDLFEDDLDGLDF